MSAVDKIRAELAAATSGPWTYLPSGTAGASDFRGSVVVYQEGKPRWVCEVPTEEIVKNGPFIAHAPTYVAALIEVAEAAERLREWITKGENAANGGGCLPLFCEIADETGVLASLDALEKVVK